MIARFRVLLPYTISLPAYDRLEPVNSHYDDFLVTAYPPMRANVDASVCDVTSSEPLLDALANLAPEAIVTVTGSIKINNQETIQANLLQIDIRSEQDFNRRRDNPDCDPPVEFLFRLANNVIAKIRSVGHLSRVKFLIPNDVAWGVTYLDDNGNPFPRDDAFAASYFLAKMSFSVSAVTSELWKLAFTLPVKYEPHTWYMLMLDAEAQLPNVNAALVLANAALEAFIDQSLDLLVDHSSLSRDSWNWIVHRGGNWMKQLSAIEKYDQALKLLTGKSLREENTELWHAFEELRKARNSIAHKGEASIVRKTRKKKSTVTTEITPEAAKQMVTNAKKIVLWVESLLPEQSRRLIFGGQRAVKLDRAMTGSGTENIALWGVGTDAGPLQIKIHGKSDSSFEDIHRENRPKTPSNRQ